MIVSGTAGRTLEAKVGATEAIGSLGGAQVLAGRVKPQLVVGVVTGLKLRKAPWHLFILCR